MPKLLDIIAFVAILAFCGWAYFFVTGSGERCIAAGHTYSYCRGWGVFW